MLIAAFVWISRRAATAGGGLFSLGRSRAKRYSEEQPKVTFDDVAGIDEAENELIEAVDFLKNPDKYQRLGGTMPKGVLLVGAPGTGVAAAVAVVDAERRAWSRSADGSRLRRRNRCRSGSVRS